MDPFEDINWRPSKAVKEAPKAQGRSVLLLTINSNIALHHLYTKEDRQKLHAHIDALMKHLEHQALTDQISRPYQDQVSPVLSFEYEIEVAPTTGLVHAHALMKFTHQGQVDMAKVKEAVQTVFPKGACHVKRIPDAESLALAYIRKGKKEQPRATEAAKQPTEPQKHRLPPPAFVKLGKWPDREATSLHNNASSARNDL